jgi:hypothetical protein
MTRKTNLSGVSPLLRQAALAITLIATASQAQLIQEWTHFSDLGESSTAVGMGNTNYMWVGDNEDESLRLYLRYPTGACPVPVHIENVRSNLSLSLSNPEADIEASTLAYDTNGAPLIFWLGSHSNSRNSGGARPNRNRFFATPVTGDGTGTPPYDLTYRGRYDNLRDDLINWDHNNLHGKGADYYGLQASATIGVQPTNAHGFSLEGLVPAPDSKALYLGFRTPLINDDGFTVGTPGTDRTNALIVPLLNPLDLVTNNPVAGPGAARFGAPIELFLGRRGIRSLDRVGIYYVILAGPPDAAGPNDPDNFRLYTWTGQPEDRPVERSAIIPTGYSPEGIVSVPWPLTDTSQIQLVSDDGTSCWRSFTVSLGFGLPILTNGTFSGANFQFTLIGRSNYTYQITRSDNAGAFGALSPNLTVTLGATANSATVTDTTVPSGTISRRYRAATATTGFSRSGNALGFERMTAVAGYNLVGNQFDNQKGNSLTNIFTPDPPDGTAVYVFNDITDTYDDSYTFLSGYGWLSGTEILPSLPPGIGFWLQPPSSYTFSFIGQVPEGKLLVPIPDGLSLRSSKVAQSGGVQSVLGFSQLVVGDKIYRLLPGTSSYNIFTNAASGWTPSEPSINIGEGFWVERPAWTRTYKVW